MSVGDATADEALLLDLLNSTRVRNGVRHDALDTRAAARTWMRQHGIPATDVQWRNLVEARSVLRAVIRGERSASAVAPLVAGVTYRARATDAGLAWELDAERGGDAAVRAVLAWDHIQRSSPGRLRPCANAGCSRFLFDRSKSNTAKWCSMAVCGNRMKARRHYGRVRADARTPNQR